MSMLPLDLVLEIFYALPAKCLLRFRCLSKLFRSTIDRHDFINLHLQRAITRKTNHHVIIQSQYGGLAVKTFMTDLVSLKNPSVKVSPSVENYLKCESIFGCCNGVVALCRMGAIKGSHSTRDLALWNPSRREYLMLPSLAELEGDICNNILGFGYDDVADDYKVVLWKYYPKISKGTLVIYSLKTSSWTKPITKDFPNNTYFPETYGVFYRSSFHWIVCTNKYEHFRIASFNLQSEEFQIMPLDHLRQNTKSLVIFVYKGCICMTYSFYEEGVYKVEVWMMKEYGVPTSFTKISAVDITLFGPICFILFLERLNKKFCWCNPENQRYGQAELHDGAPGYFSAVICAATLFVSTNHRLLKQVDKISLILGS